MSDGMLGRARRRGQIKRLGRGGLFRADQFMSERCGGARSGRSARLIRAVAGDILSERLTVDGAQLRRADEEVAPAVQGG
jgi:hypothetical protein